MKVNIKATNITLTPDIESYIDKRLGALSRFLDTSETEAKCQVEVGKTTKHHNKGDIYRAEINIDAAGKIYYASSELADLFAAIDDVKSEVEQEITRAKDKKTSLIRKGGAKLKSMLRRFYGRG